LQIWTGGTEKNEKYEKVIQCHLGVIVKAPAFYWIDPHHYPIAQLKWQSQKKKCSWMNPHERRGNQIWHIT